MNVYKDNKSKSMKDYYILFLQIVLFIVFVGVEEWIVVHRRNDSKPD